MVSKLPHLLLLMAVAFLVTYVMVPVVKRLAFRLNAIDYPGYRRVNKTPIPRMGGLAMYTGVMAALLVEFIGEQFLDWNVFYQSAFTLSVFYPGVVLGFTAIVITGVIDDVKALRPFHKMIGQIIAAVILVASGILLESIKNPFGAGFITFGWFAYPLTVLYLMAFMNVINLIDGLDGLAAGITAIATFTLFLVALGKFRMETAMFCVVTLGVTLAFLRYNFNPASIFMGDSGSLFLGTMLGVISLLGVIRSSTVVVLAASLIIAAIPIMDSVVAVIRRVLAHQPIQQADAKHLHHKLLREGYSMRTSVLILYAWTAFLAIGAFAISNTAGMLVFVVFVILAIGSFMIVWRLGILEPVLRHYYNKRIGRIPSSHRHGGKKPEEVEKAAPKDN
ncbi:glycosyltransferase family 4 protein [Slackia heliotrinireducens]|uniref:UDP-N-acetylmuramyl pentapeptide phosphotransferase/UDP-N-acetylglucosamine-1-phosphate transferase n=1 Tax=Slackia heliotrinireducens (strain ATCC 29202 / DSM 20476 / NCTC 11029 / RHS 1) TaxID=471855 RepID=C7N6F2_SLAHD|nr:MraY family glycosyltransferase [Slackia heliotrinireducens]ACV22487.1 UDP-N-acetylmuramyl pentapeptide phosphotransferase/UDP-N-acetylglucosamine-1-phosphate transferase [Slackia heliotrinireducens DSM 20476]VEH00890.1 Phospho-N-acetylmuramoyl-pentapeptide-transferase [Slackia heliotrinireducens]